MRSGTGFVGWEKEFGSERVEEWKSCRVSAIRDLGWIPPLREGKKRRRSGRGDKEGKVPRAQQRENQE
jgi:hypothetical protein